MFLGSHRALDFLNTRASPRGQLPELIGDGPSFAEWLQAASLLDVSTAARLKRRFGARGLDACAAEARTLREWARDWISRWRDAPGADYGTELSRLNELLERGNYHRKLVVGKEGMRVVERYRIDSPRALIGLVAAPIASLVATENPALVKRCGGAGCTLWFLDRTKAHRRVFCSATACGNRARVAAFRERQRDRRG